MVKGITQAQQRSVARLTQRALIEGWDATELQDQIVTKIGLDDRYSAAVDRYKDGLLAKGTSRGQAAALAKDYGKRLRAARALTIAQTEMAKATAEAKRDLWKSWQQTGMIDQYAVRVFHTHKDERLCPQCRQWNGARAGVGKDYRGQHNGPPLHPNCRCTESLERGPTVLMKADWNPDEHPRDHKGQFSRTPGVAIMDAIVSTIRSSRRASRRRKTKEKRYDDVYDMGDPENMKAVAGLIKAEDEGETLRATSLMFSMKLLDIRDTVTEYADNPDADHHRDRLKVLMSYNDGGSVEAVKKRITSRIDRVMNSNQRPVAQYLSLAEDYEIREMVKWHGACVTGDRLEEIFKASGLTDEQGTAMVHDTFDLSDEDMAMGWGYAFVNALHAQWADTSSDTDSRAWATQAAIAEFMRKRYPNAKWSFGGNGYEDIDKVADRGKWFYTKHQPVYDAWMQAEYEQTQTLMAGVDTLMSPSSVLTLFRNHSYDDLPGKLDSEPVQLKGKFNPGSSWAFTSEAAQRFGGHTHVANIPREMVVGNSLNGFGCLSEFEVITSIPTLKVWALDYDTVATTQVARNRIHAGKTLLDSRKHMGKGQRESVKVLDTIDPKVVEAHLHIPDGMYDDGSEYVAGLRTMMKVWSQGRQAVADDFTISATKINMAASFELSLLNWIDDAKRDHPYAKPESLLASAFDKYARDNYIAGAYSWDGKGGLPGVLDAITKAFADRWKHERELDTSRLLENTLYTYENNYGESLTPKKLFPKFVTDFTTPGYEKTGLLYLHNFGEAAKVTNPAPDLSNGTVIHTVDPNDGEPVDVFIPHYAPQWFINLVTQPPEAP